MTQRARERRWKAECDVGARGGDGRTETGSGVGTTGAPGAGAPLCTC